MRRKAATEWIHTVKDAVSGKKVFKGGSNMKGNQVFSVNPQRFVNLVTLIAGRNGCQKAGIHKEHKRTLGPVVVVTCLAMAPVLALLASVLTMPGRVV